MEQLQFNKGDVVFREGQYGDCFYQINSGAVETVVRFGEADEQKLAELKAGDLFGEMAVFEAYPRSATIVVKEDGTRLTRISEKDINSFFAKNPGMILEVMRHLSSRIRELTLEYNEAKAALDSAESAKASESLMSRILRFLSFGRGAASGESAEAIREKNAVSVREGYHCRVQSYSTGTVIFREGETANCMYDIHWGKVGIFTGYGTDHQNLLTELTVNQFFGEMGMIEEEPRSATAVALENNTTLEVIYPEDLEELFSKNPAKVEMIIRHLSYRLRRLTDDYMDVCDQLARRAGK